MKMVPFVRTWKTVTVAHRRVSKFFLSHPVRLPSGLLPQNLHPNRFMPRMLKKKRFLSELKKK